MPGGSLTCRWTTSLKFGYSSWGPESDWQLMLADTSSAWKWPFSLSHSPNGQERDAQSSGAILSVQTLISPLVPPHREPFPGREGPRTPKADWTGRERSGWKRGKGETESANLQQEALSERIQVFGISSATSAAIPEPRHSVSLSPVWVPVLQCSGHVL